MAITRTTFDFFASQQVARRRTALLVATFLVAILATTSIFYVAVLFLVTWIEYFPSPFSPLTGGIGHYPSKFWDWALFSSTAAGVTALTGVGIAHHVTELGHDGAEAVAQMLGGTPVRPAQSGEERQLQNVVEEMSIAAGLPVPRVFVVRGDGAINAFAAGWSPDDAVLAVTRGSLEQLSRDELQGVVAHEFSHILNGDMAFNMRLMGAVSGLSVLRVYGRKLFELARGWGSWRRGFPLFAFIGLLVMVAGAIGAACGKLIRFAVSRQREYLADAAAVQFTRNPDGLAGALRKIAEQGVQLWSYRTPETSHFLFADTSAGALERWFSTHPPVEERLRRLQPLGPRRRLVPAGAAGADAAAASGRLVTPGQFVAAVGALLPGQLERASEMLGQLPPELIAAARDPIGARALACGLLLAREPGAREEQLRKVPLEPAVLAEVRRLAPGLDALGRERSIAALDLALPSLDALSAQQLEALRDELRGLAEAAGRVSVYRWAIERTIVRRVDCRQGRASAPVRHSAVADVEVECLEILSLLAWSGGRDEASAQAALDAATRELGVRGRWRPLPRARIGAAQAERALATFDEAAPMVKRQVLASCVACVLADGQVTADEAGLLRAISSSFGCPLGPVLPTAEPSQRRAGGG